MLLWIKAFHIIFVVAWFAGIFYLPRLFVYHAMTEDQQTRNHLKIMERKLYKFITPFALLTVILGLYLVYVGWDYYKSAGWFYSKMACVILLLGYHFYCGKLVKQFARDENIKNHIYYRWFNELPVLLLFAIVILVVVRPF